MSSKRKDERSKLHHYVPEFYLKQFSIRQVDDNKGLVWRFERGVNLPIAVPPRRAAVEVDYNTVVLTSGEKSDAFEKFLSGIEQGVRSILPSAICTEERVLSQAEREKLAFFIVISMLRVPESRKLFNKMRADLSEMAMRIGASVPGRFESILEEIEAQTGKKVEATAQEVREFILGRKYRIKVPNIVSLDLMLHQAKELWPVIFHMRWNVLSVRHDSLFLTSDNPVIYVNPHARGLWGTALMDVDIELTFPISPEKCLLLTHDTELRQKAAALSTPQEIGRLISATPVKMEYSTVSSEIVEEINRRTTSSATRWIFSSTTNAALQRFMENYFPARSEPTEVGEAAAGGASLTG